MSATITEKERLDAVEWLKSGFAIADEYFSACSMDELILANIDSVYDFYETIEEPHTRISVQTLCRASATLWDAECVIRDPEAPEEKRAEARRRVTQANRLRNKAIATLDDSLLRIWPKNMDEDAVPVIGTYGFALDSFITLLMKGKADESSRARYSSCARQIELATSDFLDAAIIDGRILPTYMEAIAASRTRYYAR